MVVLRKYTSCFDKIDKACSDEGCSVKNFTGVVDSSFSICVILGGGCHETIIWTNGIALF